MNATTQKTILIEFTTRDGRVHQRCFTVAAGLDRLAALEAIEQRTVEFAPTDSGDTRFAYNAELTALWNALVGHHA